ncbi:MAG TPA: hypothetical protein VFT87_02165 [Candidatus Saccharimonadales bacterium]|nr:hypothetical protein [Candidatus Saccharimonadales bacterium]
MHGLIREEGSFGANPSTKDLARHLFTRMSCGKVVIVTDHPQTLMSPLRKQWLKLMRRVQRERSSTLHAARIAELSNTIARMQSLKFAIGYPPDDYPSDVCLATVEQLLRWAPDCRTMYVTCQVAREHLHLISALMPPNSLIVILKAT